MGTPLLTSAGAQLLVDGSTATSPRYFALGDATEGGSTLNIGKDRSPQDFSTRKGPVQHENGGAISLSINALYDDAADPGDFADPHIVDVIGQVGVIFPTIIGDGLSITGGVDGSPVRITGTAIVREGFEALISPFVRMVRFETDGSTTDLVTPVLAPADWRTSSHVTLDGTLPVVLAVHRNSATNTGDNAFVLPNSANAQVSDQEWRYFNGLQMVTPASASYNGEIELKTGAPNPSAAVTVLAAFNCRPYAEGSA